MVFFTLSAPIGNGSFIEELERRQREFPRLISATLQGSSSGGLVGTDETPEDLSWVIFQEFGTATKRVGDSERGIPGPGPPYTIEPVNAEFLRFPDPEGKFPDSFKNAEGDVILSIVKEHPGIRPGGFIRAVLDGDNSLIKVQIKKDILESLSKDFNQTTLVENFLTIVMPKVRDIIADSMDQVLTGTRADGRLGGSTAAEVFRRAALIVLDQEE